MSEPHRPYRTTAQRLWLWLLMAAVWLPQGALGEVLLQTPHYNLDVTQELTYFEDTESQHRPQDFTDPALLQQFTPMRTPVIRRGYTDTTLWLRLQITNKLVTPTNALLFLTQPNIGKVAVYKETGYGVELVERVGSATDNVYGFVRHRAPVVRLVLGPGESSYYLVAVSTGQYLSMSLHLADPGSFYQRQFTQQMSLGLGLGVLLMLAIYGALGYWRNRDPGYLALALYALAIGYYILAAYGHLGYYWFPQPDLQSRLEAAGVILVFAAALHFARSVTDLPQTRPRLDLLSRSLLVVMLLGFVTVLFLDVGTGSRVSVFLSLLGLLLFSYCTIMRAFDGYNPARVLVLSRLILLFVGLITVQTVFGMLAVAVELMPIFVASLVMDCLVGVMAVIVRQRAVRRRQEQQRREVAVEEAERRAKTEFLTQLSHEIRTPMNGILGMAELLEDSPLSPAQEDYVRTINTSGNNLLKILDDILDYSKIETGTMTLDVSSFDIATMVSECVEMFQQRAEEKGIELITHIHEELPFHVKGDPLRIRQVLANIISNAIKFTDHGEIVIEVSPDPDRGPQHICFAITDTGVGMTRDELEALFQHQGNHLEQLNHHGLGLPISQQLVRIMEGEIGATSQLNRGSRFWFSVPLEPDPSNQDAPLVADQLQGLQLLVVDDNASCRLVLQQHASNWGLQVSTAINGRQALAMLHNQATIHEPFEVVILDHEMPGMTGLELAARIKEDPLIDNDPLVLMLTGLGMAPSAAAARNAGIRRVISKPVAGRALKSTLLEELAHLRRIRADHEPRTEQAEPLVPMHILVAEDHHLSQKVVRGMLARLGMKAETVDNGREAVQRATSEHFDIILMDCEMPDMNGFEATRAIRQWEQEQQRVPVPIVALTAHIMDEHKERSQASGMNDYLTKPIELSELRDVLQRWQDAPHQEPARLG